MEAAVEGEAERLRVKIEALVPRNRGDPDLLENRIPFRFRQIIVG
jgi:hypothetical protein